MNIPKRAIELAIDGGWKPIEQAWIDVDYSWKREVWFITKRKQGSADFVSRTYAEIALDPHFWSCLGKSLGWSKGEYPDQKEPTWKLLALRFFDLILTNQPTDPFWQSLLQASTDE